MHSYFTAVAALVALFCSFYKEHLAPVQAPSVKHAFILLQYVAQVAVVLLALWTAIDTGRKAEQIRIAQLDADAAQAASQHTVPILDYYFLKLLPNASLLKNYYEYQDGLVAMPTSLQERNAWERVATPSLIQERDAALEAFSGMQRIARSVLTESIMYGQRYPSKLVEWASRTLEIKANDLPRLLSINPDGTAYAELTGLSIGFSTNAAREAMARLEK